MFKKEKTKTKQRQRVAIAAMCWCIDKFDARAYVISQKFQTIFDFVWRFTSLQMHTFSSSVLASKALKFKQTQNALNEILIMIQEANA